MVMLLSPPQRLLLVNTRERNRREVMLPEITINFTIKNFLVFVPFMAMIKPLI